MEKIRFSKRLMALLVAGVLSTTASALADGTKDTDTYDSNPKLYAQVTEFSEMTAEDFDRRVAIAYNELKDKLGCANPKSKDYGEFIQSLQCLVYDTNIDLIKNDKPFIEAGLVFGPDSEHGRIDNMLSDDKLLRTIQDYNQSLIKNLNDVYALKRLSFNNVDKAVFNKYIKKFVTNKKYTFADAVYEYNNLVERKDAKLAIIIEKVNLDGEELEIPFCQEIENRAFAKYLAKVYQNKDFDIEVAINNYIDEARVEIISQLINPSYFCEYEDDQYIMNVIFNSCAYAYLPVAMGTNLVDYQAYDDAFKALASLNSEESMLKEGKVNANELSTGAERLCQKILGVGLLNTQYDYMQYYYEKERREYYNPDDIENNKWTRDGKEIDANNMSLLETVVSNNVDMKKVAVEFINNKLMSALAGMCDDNFKSNGV